MTLESLLVDTDAIGMRPVVRSQNEGVSRLIERPVLSRRTTDSISMRDDVSAIAGDAARSALEKLGLAIVLLRCNRSVLMANTAAKRIEARRDCFVVRSNKLQMADRRNQLALETHLGQSSQPAFTPDIAQLPCCPGPGGHGYLICVQSLVAATHSGERIVSLMIYEPRSAGSIGHDTLAKLYGLTKSESQLVAALFNEPVLQVAADQIRISLNTAKTHLKHVFAKCGVRSKAELVRLLALGPRTT